MSNDEAWWNGKTFSTNWTGRHFAVWKDIFSEQRTQPLRILEIGSWEGRSAVFFLSYFPNATLTCIDTFQGSVEHRQNARWSVHLDHIEGRFDANVAEFGDRVIKIKDTSLRALSRLVIAEAVFDLIFIDGSHHSADVMTDAVMTWAMAAPGGVVIFDDYGWNQDLDEIEKPRLGVDNFLATRCGGFRELHRGYQLIVQKLAA